MASTYSIVFSGFQWKACGALWLSSKPRCHHFEQIPRSLLFWIKSVEFRIFWKKESEFSPQNRLVFLLSKSQDLNGKNHITNGIWGSFIQMLFACFRCYSWSKLTGPQRSEDMRRSQFFLGRVKNVWANQVHKNKSNFLAQYIFVLYHGYRSTSHFGFEWHGAAFRVIFPPAQSLVPFNFIIPQVLHFHQIWTNFELNNTSFFEVKRQTPVNPGSNDFKSILQWLN